MADKPIGTCKGPGSSPREFTFITTDPDQIVRTGEFVFYRASVEGQSREILARVTQRIPLRNYPDAFLVDPTIPPSEIGALLGFQTQEYEIFEITVDILGYYDSVLGDFVNPRVPPRAGLPIFIAPDEMLAQVLSKKQASQIGSLHIGSLFTRAPDAVPIVVDARSVTSTHMAIIASTGAGKSYLAGVLLEELLSPRNRAAVLVVDPHAEYDTLTEMKQRMEFALDGYIPDVRIFRPENVQVRISSLTIGDLRYLLPNLSERMHWLLGRAVAAVQANGDHWTLQDLQQQVRRAEQQANGSESDSDDDTNFGTSNALAWRLDSIFGHSRVFDNFRNLPLRELFRPGQCTILQLNEIDEREQAVIVSTILRRLLKARMDTEKKRVNEQSEFYLPYPTFVLMEEAHRFAPASADLVSSQILKTVLAEGRKFGIGIGLISQRPGKLDSDVLSQCMTQFIMRIVNPVDQGRVAESVESVGRELLNELPALSKGQVIVSGTAINTPVLCRVRQRVTRHGAEDPDAPARWLAFFDTRENERGEREQALPKSLPRKREPFK